MFRLLEPEHLIPILLIVLLLFGGKRLPEIAGALGSGLRQFRAGMHEGETEGRDRPERAEGAPVPTAAPRPTPDDRDADREPKRLLM